MKCTLHPDYKGQAYPRNKDIGCICLMVFAFRHGLKMPASHIRKLMEAHRALGTN